MKALKGLRMGCYALFAATANLAVAAEIQRFESPLDRVSVVELFTSHGCSSCPPADEWLSRLSQAPGLWDRVIPLAFHVDYWDYLGWRDRFASGDHSERQRNYRHSGGLGSVYTPGVLVNGAEWRGWYWGRPLPDERRPEVGRLQLDISPHGPAVLRFSPGSDWRERPLKAHLAIVGVDLESRIGAGENRGRILRESFVVLGHRGSTHSVERHSWRLDWPAFEPAHPGRHAVVAWISGVDAPTPLQAVGGWLEEPPH